MTKEKKKTWDFPLFKRIMTFISPYKSLFYFTVFLTILLAFLGLIKPIIMGQMIGEYIGNSDAKGLLNQTLLIISLMIIEAIAQYYFSFQTSLLGQKIVEDLRNKLLKHVINFKLKFFDKTPIGQVVTRLVSDMEVIGDIFSNGIIIIIGDVLKLIVVISYMFYTNWDLSLLVLAPIPILLWATNIFKKAIKSAFQQVRTQVSKLNTFVQEHITGMNIVQIFGREQEEAKQFREINDKHKIAHIKSVWAYSIFFPVVEILSALSLTFLVIYIVLQTDVPGIKIDTIAEELTTFILFIHMLYRPIRMLADRFNVVQMGMVGAERVFTLLDQNEIIPTKQNPTQFTNFKGEVNFENVWFAYNNEDWVLKNITFNVKQGETIALVGATGAGKSTIINLLSRFYEFQKGKINIDNENIRTVDLEQLRHNVSVVLQDVFLFSGSIKKNISLDDDSISDEEIIKASKAVGAHEYISKLPNGYNFDVRERGGMLSAGQRQLLAFIRAYVYNPKILVLDEATSSVDTETELLIQKAIEKLTENRTSIIIAHRLSTIKKADRIYVLDKGEIIEYGSHTELLNQDGQYKHLYDLQFK